MAKKEKQAGRCGRILRGMFLVLCRFRLIAASPRELYEIASSRRGAQVGHERTFCPHFEREAWTAKHIFPKNQRAL